MRVVHNIEADRFAIENIIPQQMENLLHIFDSLDCLACSAISWCYNYKCCTDWSMPIQKALEDRDVRKTEIEFDSEKGVRDEKH